MLSCTADSIECVQKRFQQALVLCISRLIPLNSNFNTNKIHWAHRDEGTFANSRHAAELIPPTANKVQSFNPGFAASSNKKQLPEPKHGLCTSILTATKNENMHVPDKLFNKN